jgi:tetratricopeptide (TPR) repeat protein
MQQNPSGHFILVRPWPVSLALGLLCAVTLSGQNTVKLVGRVLTEQGQALTSGVSLRLEAEDGALVAQQTTDSSGHFEFDDVAKHRYRLSATAEGFQPLEQNLDLTQAADTSVVSLLLRAASGAKSPAGGISSLTDTSAPKRARKEHEKGIRAAHSGDLPVARTHLENAVSEYPCYARAQTALAWVLIEQHDFAPAEAALRRGIECDRGFPTAYTELAQLLNAQRRFAESEELMQKGLRYWPDQWQFHYQLGAAHLGLGQYAKAEQEFLRVQSLNPAPPPEFHVKLADLYTATGTYAKAYAEMKAYLQAEPEGHFAARIKGIMKQMESSGAVQVGDHGAQAPSANH